MYYILQQREYQIKNKKWKTNNTIVIRSNNNVVPQKSTKSVFKLKFTSEGCQINTI